MPIDPRIESSARFFQKIIGGVDDGGLEDGGEDDPDAEVESDIHEVAEGVIESGVKISRVLV